MLRGVDFSDAVEDLDLVWALVLRVLLLVLKEDSLLPLLVSRSEGVDIGLSGPESAVILVA